MFNLFTHLHIPVLVPPRHTLEQIQHANETSRWSTDQDTCIPLHLTWSKLHPRDELPIATVPSSPPCFCPVLGSNIPWRHYIQQVPKKRLRWVMFYVMTPMVESKQSPTNPSGSMVSTWCPKSLRCVYKLATSYFALTESVLHPQESQE